MADYTFKAGATSKSVTVFVGDSSVTTGAGLTGLAYNTASLTAYYRKGATGTPTAITLATLANAQAAWSSGGFVVVDGTNMPGLYRLDLPNAAIDTAGVVEVYLHGATNMRKTFIRVECTTLDVPNDGITRATLAAETGLQTIRSNTAASAASSSITLDASASSTNDYYNGTVIYITGNTGVGQSRTITDYVGSTKVATISPNWTTNPDNTSTFAIRPSFAEDSGTVADAFVTEIGEVTFLTVEEIADALNAEVLGSGSDQCTMQILVSGVPQQGAEVWITTDEAGTNTVAGPVTTDSSGNATFLLTAGNTYYLFARKDGMDPITGGDTNSEFVAVAD